jgi:hypothetical protein
MKTKPITLPKQKRYSVMISEVEQLNTSNYEEAQTEIARLQKESMPTITLNDHKERKAIDFKKSIHQQNYRITPGNYVSVVVAEAPKESDS